MHRTFIIVAVLGLVAGAGCSKKSATTEVCVKAADAYLAASDKRSRSGCSTRW
jgi:20S proteasome alpha/beta subunit